MQTGIYLDYAATTPLSETVKQAMQEAMAVYGNPSSVHPFGQRAKRLIETAREQVAALLGASQPRDVIFTSGGTEADNLAIAGTAYARQEMGRHIITSAIEHHAVLETCKALEKRGFEVTYLPVSSEGVVEPGAVEEALRPGTTIVSVMMANNETGAIQPLDQILAACKGYNEDIVVHTDAVQAAGVLAVDASGRGFDLVSIAAHKIYGPKGVGALYMAPGLRLDPLLHGGAQERRRRPGTENTLAIAGFGAAAAEASQLLEQSAAHLQSVRDQLETGLTTRLDGVRVHAKEAPRLPGHSNLAFADLDGQALLYRLAEQGVAASTGSACTSGAVEPSHVLEAMGLPPEEVNQSIRFSLGRCTTTEEINQALEIITAAVHDLRSLAKIKLR